MKKYVKPVFYAESYMFSDSIAKCDTSLDPSKAMVINVGDNLCTAQDGGDVIGKNKNALVKNFPVTVFNDGTNIWQNKTLYTKDDPDYVAIGCDYDWNMPKEDMVYTSDSNPQKLDIFSQTFYGNGASNSNEHRPGYKNAPFFS